MLSEIWVLAVGLLGIALSQRCLSDRYKDIAGHTACLNRSTHARTLPALTQPIKDEIVNLHNNYRSLQNASNMQRMIWDDELAKLSQKWTDNCVYEHDTVRNIPGSYSVGQNLGLGHSSFREVLTHFYSEIQLFRYNNQNAMQFHQVGHYTQMVWAESAKVGCAWTKCTNLNNRNFLACNYATAGNMRFWIPFDRAEGSRCSECPLTCNSQGLCDCGGKVCENGGTMNINTCQCSCVKSYHVGQTCSMDCRAAVDSQFCGSFYKLEMCATFVNVPTECPTMCRICPGADYRLYTSNETTTTFSTQPTVRQTENPITTSRTGSRAQPARTTRGSQSVFGFPTAPIEGIPDTRPTSTIAYISTTTQAPYRPTTRSKGGYRFTNTTNVEGRPGTSITYTPATKQAPSRHTKESQIVFRFTSATVEDRPATTPPHNTTESPTAESAITKLFRTTPVERNDDTSSARSTQPEAAQKPTTESLKSSTDIDLKSSAVHQVPLKLTLALTAILLNLI